MSNTSGHSVKEAILHWFAAQTDRNPGLRYAACLRADEGQIAWWMPLFWIEAYEYRFNPWEVSLCKANRSSLAVIYWTPISGHADELPLEFPLEFRAN